ncbi:MAG TPA: TIGR03067 domain-containing protein [Gemmataceae bacterium]|nr:TIGR03067 domain-containing protein [Gemmataceae bacterium]
MYSSLLLGLAVAVGAPGKDAPKEKASIVGTWNGEKAVAGGKDLPVPEGGVSFTFTEDGKVMVTEGKREKPDTGTYKLDPKKDPAEIDLTPPPEKKEKVVLGIYKLDGDTLTLCFGKDGGARPTKFESPEGSQVIVITLQRAKKE